MEPYWRHDLKEAKSFFQRLLGLMFIKEMKDMDALLFDNCRSIHNSFVRFPIDVLFLDKEDKVVKVIKGFRPWRWTRIYWRAKKVIEFPAGALPTDIVPGDEVEFQGV